MPTLPESRIGDLLEPYLATASASALHSKLRGQLSTYLDLLLRWNARTNLTAIRDPEEIVRRHFGESLFAGLRLAPLLEGDPTLLDYGSGAGFPGLPIQLLLPQVAVILAESQHKKSTFLREVIRTLELPTEVWPDRVNALPPERRFDVVTLRAVDRMPEALSDARRRVRAGGWLVALSADPLPDAEVHGLPDTSRSFLSIQRQM